MNHLHSLRRRWPIARLDLLRTNLDHWLDEAQDLAVNKADEREDMAETRTMLAELLADFGKLLPSQLERRAKEKEASRA